MATETPKPPSRTARTTAWLDEDMIRMAKTIAAEEGISVTEVIEAAAKETIRKRYQKLIDKRSAELGGEGG
jgi:hypothetical protein